MVWLSHIVDSVTNRAKKDASLDLVCACASSSGDGPYKRVLQSTSL